MRILDRYIIKSIISIFLSTIFIFSILYIIIDMTSNLDEIIGRKVSFIILAKYYLSFLPIIITQTATIACLISSLFTYSHLHNSNEIIAMRSSGLNFWQITKPALCFALVVSAFVFWLNEAFVPQASALSQQIRDENLILQADRENKKRGKIENLTFYGLNNRLYFIDKFNLANNELEGVTIISHDESQNLKEKIVALRGVWTGVTWKFYQCQVTTYESPETDTPPKIKIYPEKLMDIKENPEDFLRQRINVSSMNIRQLREYINRFSHSGATKAINNLRVDFHQKIAYPLGTFVVVLVGLPLAMMVKNRKGMTFTSLGIAIGVGFLFYVTNAVGLAFGKGDLFPPILAAWVAPLIFSATAVILIENNF